jgi:diacylglycerol kinase
MLRWFSSVFRSFGPALAGLSWALKTQRNAQAHAVITMVVIVLSLWLKLETWEWCAVVLSTGLVWVAELLNTAIEALADRVSMEREDAIRRVKDMAASAVLMSALTACAVGLLIFLPKLWQML